MVAAVAVTATAAVVMVVAPARPPRHSQYNLGFYYTYLTLHPDIQVVVTSPADQVIAYSMFGRPPLPAVVATTLPPPPPRPCPPPAPPQTPCGSCNHHPAAVATPPTTADGAPPACWRAGAGLSQSDPRSD